MANAPIVLFFDIDGTLIDTAGAGRAAMLCALQELFGVQEVRGGVDFAGRTDRAIAHDLLRVHGIEPTPATIETFFHGYCRWLPQTLAERPQATVLPRVQEVLDELQSRSNLVLALLTGNIRRGAYTKLSHFGLASYFPFGGFGDRHLDRAAVAREALAALRRHLGTDLDPQRCFVIGDTVHDVRCARAIGARAVAVLTGWSRREELEAERPDAMIHTMAELQALLPT